MVAAVARGWDRDRHDRYKTTDMPVSAAAEVDQLVRERVFARVLRPHAGEIFALGWIDLHCWGLQPVLWVLVGWRMGLDVAEACGLRRFCLWSVPWALRWRPA